MKHTPYLILALLSLCLVAPAQTFHSVLSNGEWLKMSLCGEGVYRITPSDLSAAGIGEGVVPVSSLRIMGRANVALPERCADPRPDDLSEMAISVFDLNENGLFDGDDYALFYATGCVNWRHSADTVTSIIYYDRNPYTDTTFCYLNFGVTDGKRVQVADRTEGIDGQGAATVFTECLYHEEELVNVISSGRVWFGEAFTDSLALSFNLKDYAEGLPVRMSIGVMGRSSNMFKFDVLDGDTALLSEIPVPAYPSNTFGYEVSRNTSYVPASSNIDLLINVTAQQSATLYLDKIVINYPRRLKYRGSVLPFTIRRDTTSNSAVVIGHACDGLVVWDVTDPLEPTEVQYVSAGDNCSFGLANDGASRFVAFEADKTLKPVSLRRIDNQNLHGISYADMIILSPAKYIAYADEIALFHHDNDAMDVVSLPVEKVYDEFSAGNTDPTALRDFIRMVYLRSNAQLKYVLLLGKASYDVRNILGRGVDYVPTYETAMTPCHEVNSFCSDDYYGMMDDDEGPECVDLLDIAVGRIPVNNESDAVIAIRKIKDYCDIRKTHGSWRARNLFVADAGDTYQTNSDLCSAILEAASPETLLQKNFFAAYPVVNMSSGEFIPAANADLNKRLDNGTLVMFYSGHGGVTGLSKRSVFTTSDISHMQNGAMQPFVYTATCEFSKFDDPELISAGEQMLLRNEGGAITMLTTTRPTYAGNTVKVSKALAAVLGIYDDDGKPYRFGDIVRIAKTNQTLFSPANRGMVLFGDPALRIAMPTQKINIVDDDTIMPMLYPGMEIERQCFVAAPDGSVDTMFNGVAEVSFYAGKSNLTTLYDNPHEFKFYNDEVFNGMVTVQNGIFTFKFVLPQDIEYQTYEDPSVFLYAYDSIRGVDAWGTWRGLLIDDGQSETSDFEGPEIELSWNNGIFHDGDTVVPRGGLFVNISDESGVYHYDYLIGRDIVLTSSVEDVDNMILNDDFVPSLDDCHGGTISIPVGTLSMGDHSFTIKAWDMCGNTSTKTMVLHVIDNEIYQVGNYPNPFSDVTNFVVSSSLPEGSHVTIEIFNMIGQEVTVLSADACYGVSIEWNGTNFAGARLGAGVYPYRVTISDGEGFRRSVMQKLVITQ